MNNSQSTGVEGPVMSFSNFIMCEIHADQLLMSVMSCYDHKHNTK